MKKLVLVSLFLFPGVLQAAVGRSGVLGTFDGDSLWKSSDIIINQTAQVLTTGYVMIGYVQMSSPGINSNLIFQECTSTTTGNTAVKFYGSSVPFVGSYATTYVTQDKGFYVMEYSTMGWAYTTNGDTPARARVFYTEFPAALGIPKSRP